MYDYFFTFDKTFSDLFGEEKSSDSISVHRWYKYLEKDDKKILMCDVSGMNEEDIKINFDAVDYNGIITIEGTTETEFGKFSVKNRFKIPANFMGKDSSYYIKNGILFIEIIADKKNKFELKKKSV